MIWFIRWSDLLDDLIYQMIFHSTSDFFTDDLISDRWSDVSDDLICHMCDIDRAICPCEAYREQHGRKSASHANLGTHGEQGDKPGSPFAQHEGRGDLQGKIRQTNKQTKQAGRREISIPVAKKSGIYQNSKRKKKEKKNRQRKWNKTENRKWAKKTEIKVKKHDQKKQLTTNKRKNEI